MEDLERITKDFYDELYAHKDISKETLARVMEGIPSTFTNSMNDALDKKIMERELRGAVNSMTKGKVPGHDDIPIEFFQKMWHTIGKDFHLMVKKTLRKRSYMRELPKG